MCCAAVDAKSVEGKDWAYSTGRINEDLIAQHLFPASPDTIAGICGPPGLVNYTCLPNFKKMGYTDEQCIVF